MKALWRRGRWPLWRRAVGAGIALLIPAALSGSSWLVLLAALVAASPLVVRRLPASVVLHVTERVQVGESVRVRVRVSNTRRGTTGAGVLVHAAHGLETAIVEVPALEPGGVATATVMQRAVHRMVSPVADLRLHGAGLVSTFTAGGRQLRHEGLVVRAAPAQPPRHVLALLTAAAAHPRVGDGQPYGARLWRSGDPAGSVHWRATARVGVPVVVEREHEEPGALVLVCTGIITSPCAAPTDPAAAAAEAVVSRAAGLISAAKAAGVAIHITGPTRPAPPEGRVSADTALDWLAGLEQAAPLDARRQLAPAAVGVGPGLVAVVTTTPGCAPAIVNAWRADRGRVLDLGSETW